MTYTVVFKLNGPLAEAVAVEWTVAAAPVTHADGWEPCLRLRNGDWRFTSYDAVSGRVQHLRDAGPFENLGLRYRLSPTGPWSLVSDTRKQITIVETIDPADTPAALRAVDWTPLAPVTTETGGRTGAFTLQGPARGAVAVQWRPVGTTVWQPCAALGADAWKLAGGAGMELVGTEIVLRYRLGLAAPWSPTSRDAKTLVEASVPLPILPFVLAAPVLAGTGKVGSEVTVQPGLWGGAPAPELTWKWRCDGSDILGATAAVYVPGPQDDGKDLACAVTARNTAGSVVAVSASLRVSHVAPTAKGALFEEIFDQGAGVQTVETAADFTGLNLRFGVTGAGATVSSETGVVSIPTEMALSGEIVTVTATNSGGAASSGFAVTIEKMVEPPIILPPTPTASAWGLTAVSLVPNTHTGVFTLAAALKAVEVQWLGVDISAYASPAELEPHFNPTVSIGANQWRHASPAGKSIHLRADGTVQYNIRMRYRLEATGPWSLLSENKLALDATLLPVITDPPLPGTGWSTMPFRTEAEARAGLKGGCQEQFWHGSCRSQSNPSLIIAGQDTGGTWYSDDDGRTWRKSEDLGLVTYFMQGVAIDPVDPNVWFGVGSEGPNPRLANSAGIYKSTDRGMSWTRKRTLPGLHHQRVPHNLCFDPTTTSRPAGQRVWYAPAHYRDNQPGQVWRSTDGGETWAQRSAIPIAVGGAAVSGHLSTIWHHPSITNTVFLCTQVGLYKSTDGATTWSRMGGVGGLPTGEVVVLEINPRDGEEIYAVINRPGREPGSLWHTATGGRSWSAIGLPTGFTASKVYVGMDRNAWPLARSRTLYLVGRGGNAGPDGRLRVSHNGGATWFVADVSGRPGDLGEGAWANNISDSTNGYPRPELCARILPHPTDPMKAVAHGKSHIFRTEDKGLTWTYSGEGFTGLIWGNYQSGVAFTNDPRRFCFGVTDAGMLITKNGGQSFWHTAGHGADDPAGGTLKDSMHAVAFHPTQPDTIVGSIGFMSTASNTYLFRTTAAAPKTEASGDWKRVTDVSNPYIFLHWHKTDPLVVYANNLRSTNGGAAFAAYPSNVGGVMATFFGDNDVIYGVAGRGADTTIRWSQNKGAGGELFANVGWNITAGDVRRIVIAAHPTNRNVIFTMSGSGDLARYDRTTNAWKTNYGLIARTRAANPTMPSDFEVFVNSVAIDPQDADCVYVTMSSPGYQTIWRTLNGQGAAPVWENITHNLYRISKGNVVVHPQTGDVFYGSNGIGACRLFPPPARRASPSLAGNWPIQ